MKKIIISITALCFIVVALFVWVSNAYSQNTIINLSEYPENRFDTYISTTMDTVEINIKLAQIELWSNNEGKLGSTFGYYFEESGNYIELSSEGLVTGYGMGEPSIPFFWRFMYYPLKFINVSYKVLGYDEEIIDLSACGFDKKIIPAQPSVPKNRPPDKFYIDTITYSEDKYYNEEIAVFTEEGADLLMMLQRKGGIIIRPIQYNPVQNKLRILNNLTFQVIFSIPSNIIDSIKIIPENISVSDSVLFATYAKPYIFEGGRTYQLNIDSIKEKKIYISGKFDSSNRNSPWIIRNSTVNIGLLPAGTYELIYKFIDINPNGAMFPIETYSINFVVSENSKVQDVKIKEFDLYPNPCNSYINISFPDTDNEIRHVQMFDISGKLIYEENTNQNSLQINMSSYNRGIYFIRVVSSKSEYKHKIIKR